LRLMIIQDLDQLSFGWHKKFKNEIFKANSISIDYKLNSGFFINI
jgi:hypothetical protein